MASDSTERYSRGQPEPSGGQGTSSTGSPEPRWASEQTSLLELMAVLLRHRWKMVVTPPLVAVVLISLSVLGPPTFTSEASFMPQQNGGEGQLSRLSGVASQFGLSVPSSGGGQSPEFYADLLTSRRILAGVVQSEYEVVQEGDTVRGGLVEQFGIEAPRSSLALRNATRRLKNSLSVKTGTQTPIVELTVTTRHPALSRQIVDRALELVNQFNLEVRQSRASAQAEFVQERLEGARQDLRAAEDSLEQFLENNRRFQNSPALQFEHQRLQRQVDLKQQVVTTLATRYEEVQIDRVRNTPVLTVVTPPELPPSPDPTPVLLWGFLGLILGGLLGMAWAFGAEYVVRLRNEEESYRELQTLWDDFRRELRDIWRKARSFPGSRETR